MGMVHAVKTIGFIPERRLLGKLPELVEDRLALLRELATYGDVCAFHVGPWKVAFLNTPELAREMLVEKSYSFSKGRVMHRAVPGNGIFVSEGAVHRKRRKIMAPAFQPRYIQYYANMIVEYGERQVHEWQDEQEIEALHSMTALTTAILGKALFGGDVFDQSRELAQAMVDIFAFSNNMIQSPFLPSFQAYLRKERALKIIHACIQQLIDQQRSSDEVSQQQDMLSLLLAARDEDGESMTDEEIMDECQTLFIGGHETMAATLGWAWYALSLHPALYQRMLDEVDQVLAGRAPIYEDLPRLPYTLQVFKETMRLYPAALGYVREAVQDVQLGEYLIPKGYMVIASNYILHRLPSVFPDPEQFDPERFSPEREPSIPRNVYQPFGAGPRICIGNHFAWMEGHLLLATLAQRIRFEIAEQGAGPLKIDSKHSLTYRPTQDIRLRVHTR